MNLKLESIFVLCSGVYADKVGIEAAEMLLRNIRHNGCVDEFLQDQVRDTNTFQFNIIYMCFSGE